MGIFGFSFVGLLESFFRRSFYSAGLRQRTVVVDSATTFQIWSPTTETDKPPLLLIHGFGPVSTWQWHRQVGLLARHFHVIVPDLVFFGNSTSSSPLRSEAFQAEAVAALLDALGLDKRRVAVVGMSYGGFVAYHLARLLGPERMGPVVITSSDLLKTKADDAKMLRRAAEPGAPNTESVLDVLLPKETRTLRALITLAVHRRPKFIPEFLLRDLLQNLYKGNVERKRELIKGSNLGTEGFEVTPLPQEVLIIWGEHDHVFPVDKPHELKRRLGDKACLAVMENSGHMPQAEEQNKFNQILLEFLLSASKSTSDQSNC